MSKELLGNQKLLSEYENVFTNEEKVSNALNISKANFSIKVGYVDFDDLSFTEPIKKSRKETYLGLTTSVGELGILTPIHVMITEGYANYLDGERDEDFMGFKYIVIDGFRRIFAGKKHNLDGCNAVIWEFKDKDLGSQLVTALSRLLNRAQQHSWSEIWYLYQILEMQSSMTPGTLEYLLQLESGDAMKLKDIMLCDYQEVRDELLGNKKTLTQCYNMLQKLRKDEDMLALEDQMGLSEVEEAKGIIDDTDKRATLSDEDVKEILEMSDSFDGELSDEDFDELMGNNVGAERFEVDGDRHLDPRLRAAVLQRDGYCCQVSGVGKGLPAEVALAILNVHHLVPVADGGTNEMDNLITVSLDVHTLIHVIQRRQGRLGMKKEDFDVLPSDTQEYLKKVMKIARIAVEADRRCGKTKEQIKNDTSDAIKFKMPGTDLKENMDAIRKSK